MKRRSEVVAMSVRIERECPIQDRAMALMVLEWVLGGSISTSVGLEDWLSEQQEQLRRVKAINRAVGEPSTATGGSSL
jgi:hypothetical protein